MTHEVDSTDDSGLSFIEGALLTIALWLALIGLLSLSALMHSTAQGLDFAQAWSDVRHDKGLLALAQSGATLGLLFLALMVWQRAPALSDALALYRVPPVKIVLSFVAGLGLQILLAELSNLARIVMKDTSSDTLWLYHAMKPHSWPDALTTVLTFVAVPAVTEELFFRGFLQQQLAQRYAAWGLFLAATLFGLSHGYGIGLVYATVAGVVLGIAFQKTHSVYISIAMHGGVNALPLLIPDTLLPIRGFNTLSSDNEHIPIQILALATCIFGAAFYLLMRERSADEQSL